MMKKLFINFNIALLTVSFGVAAVAQVNSDAKNVTIKTPQRAVNPKISQSLIFEGGVHGGGGDYLVEGRIEEIRADILKWLHSAGPKNLILPQGLSSEDYKAQMSAWLAPHAVIVSAITQEESNKATSPEKKVVVDGVEKTCRGFISATDRRPHILCLVEKFNATSASNQYRLIHHEYAGLARVEKNLGASSDYQISNQLTDFLVEEKVLRLGIVKAEFKTPAVTYSGPIAKILIEALISMKVPGKSDGKGSLIFTIKDFESSTTTDGCTDGSAREFSSYKLFDGTRYEFDSCFASARDENNGSPLAKILYSLGNEDGSGWTSGVYIDSLICSTSANLSDGYCKAQYSK